MPVRTGRHVTHIEGLDNARAVLKKVTPEAQAAIKRQFDWEVDIMFKLSQVYVPKDTRALMDSGAVIWPDIMNHGVEAGISYGGHNVNPKTGETTNEYVVEVHENLDSPHELPTRSKFAETAVLERMPNLENRIARFVGPEVEARLMLHRMTRE